MSSQRLEGSDLEALLARVRSEYGEEATIVEANKVRRGGVAGFFAKESFEVVVDVDADAPTPEVATTSRPDRAPSGGDLPGDDAGQDDEEPFVPFTLDELASSVDDPAPAFTATFSEVLGRAIAAERAAALEPAWPATVAVADAYPAARIVAPRHEPGGLSGVAADLGQPGGLAPADLLALRRLGLPTDQAALVARTDDPSAVALVRLLESFPVAAPIPTAARSVVAVVGDADESLRLATSIAAQLTGTPLEALAERRGPGTRRPAAARTPRQLAAELGVVTAGTRRGADLRSPAEVEALVSRTRRRRHPVVVAVDAPFAVTPSTWATELLDALEPSLVLGHVDAGRKPEDVLAWSAALGGIDALAVTGLAGTTTPAAVLATGIPVATLDGAPATPARWAALLTDRLTAALAA